MDNSQYYKFTMTPTTAATGKQLTITNTKDVNNFVYSSLYSLANLSFNAVIPAPFFYLDGSNESLFTYNATTKVISAITIPNLTFSSVGGKWTSNFLNGKGVIDFTGQTGYIVSNSMATAMSSTSYWTISFLIQANSSVGSYTAAYTGTIGGSNRMVDNFQTIQTFMNFWPFSLTGTADPLATTTYNVVDGWYLLTIARNGPSSDTFYYVNNIFCGQGGQGNAGDVRQFVLNTFMTSVSGSPGCKRFAEVRVYNSYLGKSDVITLYQSVKSKWGI
jgi:hypothetical protein